MRSYIFTCRVRGFHANVLSASLVVNADHAAATIALGHSRTEFTSWLLLDTQRPLRQVRPEAGHGRRPPTGIESNDLGDLSNDLECPGSAAPCPDSPQSIGDLYVSCRRSDVFIHTTAADTVTNPHDNSPTDGAR